MGSVEAKPEEDVQETPPGVVLQSFQAGEQRVPADVSLKVDSNASTLTNPTAKPPASEKPRRGVWDFGKTTKADDDTNKSGGGGGDVGDGDVGDGGGDGGGGGGGGGGEEKKEEETKRRESSFFKIFSGKDTAGADEKNTDGADGAVKSDAVAAAAAAAAAVPAAAAAAVAAVPAAAQQQKDGKGSFSLKHIFGGKDAAATAAPAAPAEDEKPAQGGGGPATNGPVAKTALPNLKQAAESRGDAVQEADAGSEKQSDSFFSFLKKKGPADGTDGTDGTAPPGGAEVHSVKVPDAGDERRPSDPESSSSSSSSSSTVGGFFRSMGGKKLATVATQTDPVQVLPVKESHFGFRKK